MHMHSHPMLCLQFPGRRAASISVSLPSLSLSFSVFELPGPPPHPHFAWINWLLIFVRKLTGGLCEETEESDRRMSETEGAQWQKPRGHRSPKSRQSSISSGMPRPLCSDLYLYPLSSHLSPLQGRLVGWWSGSGRCASISKAQGKLSPNFSSLCL